MTKLSVNINKIATIRNARGGNTPNVVEAAVACENFGAEGITVHPRPDERHIRYQDVYDLKSVLQTEFNIEGYPSDRFMQLVLDVKPTQVTLVPDPPEALTSNAGWDIASHFDFLDSICSSLKEEGIRTSVFVDTDLENIRHAARLGADRIELYTEPYATLYPSGREAAVAPFKKAAEYAHSLGLRINAGHDLSLQNLAYFAQEVAPLSEVSIGHALISDALYLGLQKTIKSYLEQLRKNA